MCPLMPTLSLIADSWNAPYLNNKSFDDVLIENNKRKAFQHAEERLVLKFETYYNDRN